MTPEKLSDAQLYALLMNQHLAQEISLLVQEEFEQREYTAEQLHAMDTHWQQGTSIKRQLDLHPSTKIVIVLLPFLIPIHVILSSLYLYRGDKRKWNAYWQCITWGLAVWIAVLIVLSSLGLFTPSIAPKTDLKSLLPSEILLAPALKPKITVLPTTPLTNKPLNDSIFDSII